MPKFAFIAPSSPGLDTVAGAQYDPIAPAIAALSEVEHTLQVQWEQQRNLDRKVRLARALAEHTTLLGNVQLEAEKMSNPDEIEPFAAKRIADGTAKIASQFQSDPELSAQFELQTAGDIASRKISLADHATKAREVRKAKWLEEGVGQFANSYDLAQTPEDRASVGVEFGRFLDQFDLPDIDRLNVEQDFNQTNERRRLEKMLVDDPAAVYALASDPQAFHGELPNLAAEQRERAEGLSARELERRADRAEKIRRRAQRDADRLAKSRQKAAQDAAAWEAFDLVRSAQASGDPEQFDQVEAKLREQAGAGLLSDSKARSLIGKLDAARKDAGSGVILAGLGEQLVSMSDASGLPIDPSEKVGSSTAGKAVDAYAQEAMAAGGIGAVVEIVGKVGYVPTPVRSVLSRAARSENPQALSEAAGLYQEIKAASPQAALALDPATRKMMEEVSLEVETGGPQANIPAAIERARERMKTDPELAKARTRRLSETLRRSASLPNASLDDAIEERIATTMGVRDDWFMDERVSAVPLELREFVKRRAIAISEASDTEPEEALTEALTEAQRSWGLTTRSDGSVALVRNPPERFDPTFNAAAIAKEVVPTLAELPQFEGIEIDPSQIELEAMPEFGRRSKPAWLVKVGGVPVEGYHWEPAPPPAPIEASPESARVAMEYLVGQRDDLPGLPTGIQSRLATIRSLRNKGGPAEQAAEMAAEALTGDPDMRDLAALLSGVTFAGQPLEKVWR